MYDLPAPYRSTQAGDPVTWTRLTDNFVEDKAFEGLSPEVRWHYLCLVQYCSRTGRYDGCVTRYNARYVSGSEPASPDDVVAALVDRGLLAESPDDGMVVVIRIDEHVPPPHMRDEQRKSATKIRVQRHRERKQAERHSDSVTDVTRYTGTGQDGTGPGIATTNPTSAGVTNNGHTAPSSELLLCDACGANGPTVEEPGGWRVCVGRCVQEPS